jgi:hypothetical protein
MRVCRGRLPTRGRCRKRTGEFRSGGKRHLSANEKAPRDGESSGAMGARAERWARDRPGSQIGARALDAGMTMPRHRNGDSMAESGHSASTSKATTSRVFWVRSRPRRAVAARWQGWRGASAKEISSSARDHRDCPRGTGSVGGPANTARQPSESCALFARRQATMRPTSGICEEQSRQTSGVQALCCSGGSAIILRKNGVVRGESAGDHERKAQHQPLCPHVRPLPGHVTRDMLANEWGCRRFMLLDCDDDDEATSQRLAAERPLHRPGRSPPPARQTHLAALR